HRSLVATGRARRPGRPPAVVGPAPEALAAVDRRAHGPPAGRPHRPLGRGPGHAGRSHPAAVRLPPPAPAAVLSLAAPTCLRPAGRVTPPEHPGPEAERDPGRGLGAAPSRRIGPGTGQPAAGPRQQSQRPAPPARAARPRAGGPGAVV